MGFHLKRLGLSIGFRELTPAWFINLYGIKYARPDASHKYDALIFVSANPFLIESTKYAA